MMHSSKQQELQEALEGKRMLFVTGAGISVASGLPTYRNESGQYQDAEYESVINDAVFGVNPELVWKKILELRDGKEKIEPNIIHHEITRLVEETNGFVITQNVDGLHQKSGLTEDKLLELHGSLSRTYCSCCGVVYGDPTRGSGNVLAMPRCPDDKTILTPGVVLTGQRYPSDIHRRYVEQLNSIDADTVLLLVGTTATYYAIEALNKKAVVKGAKIVIINPGITELDNAQRVIKINQKAEDVLPFILLQ